jgi:hypothetical protein
MDSMALFLDSMALFGRTLVLQAIARLDELRLWTLMCFCARECFWTQNSLGVFAAGLEDQDVLR